MRNFFIALLCVGSNILSSCETSKETQSDSPTINEVRIKPLTSSPDFPDAILDMNFPLDEEKPRDGKVGFSYNVTNFKLGTQTGHSTIPLANSDKGQHIHLILNNEPYTAHYNTEFDKGLADGHYVALSFLSKSYHESLKSPDAYVLRQFTVGDAKKEPIDLGAPHLFYSRPKGEYRGKDAQHILLDFYLVNTSLEENGNKVKAIINDQEFMIDDWKPYVINGLPEGKNSIKLELVDREGKMIPGPFNKVERTIFVRY